MSCSGSRPRPERGLARPDGDRPTGRVEAHNGTPPPDGPAASASVGVPDRRDEHPHGSRARRRPAPRPSHEPHRRRAGSRSAANGARAAEAAAHGNRRHDHDPYQPFQHPPPPCFCPRGDLSGNRPWGRPGSLTSLFAKCNRLRSRCRAAIAFGGDVRRGPPRGRRTLPWPAVRSKCKKPQTGRMTADRDRRMELVPATTSPRRSCSPAPH